MQFGFVSASVTLTILVLDAVSGGNNESMRLLVGKVVLTAAVLHPSFKKSALPKS